MTTSVSEICYARNIEKTITKKKEKKNQSQKTSEEITRPRCKHNFIVLITEGTCQLRIQTY